MFRHYCVILRQLVINTLPSYTSIFCTMTNKCTIISQIITLLHVSTLLCHPQTACNQYLAKLHKYILYYDQQMHNYFTNYLWNNCAFVGHSTKIKIIRNEKQNTKLLTSVFVRLKTEFGWNTSPFCDILLGNSRRHFLSVSFLCLLHLHHPLCWEKWRVLVFAVVLFLSPFLFPGIVQKKIIPT